MNNMNKIYINKVKQAGVKAFIMLLAPCSLLFASCNDWLDVRSETEAKEEDMFTKKGGFKDALTGIYLTMGDRAIYGENLTMGAVEELANLWYTPGNIYPDDLGLYYFEQHDYENINAKDLIKAIYGKLYNVAVQTNLLLKNLNEQGNNIDDSLLRNVIEGEAYAIRAYVHFDLLRLFGQLPKSATVNVRLPYCETASIKEYPAYYAYNAFVQKVEQDLNQAVSLLEKSDPVMDYSLSYYNNNEDMDSYLMYRRYRLNYWAVKALQARFYMYTGDATRAHSLAMEVINAKGRTDGESIVSLSGMTDLQNNCFALPHECLFALSKYDLLDYTPSRYVGGGTSRVYVDGNDRPLTLAISETMFNELFAGVNVASDNRYLYVWNRKAATSQNNPFPCIKKYWYDTKDDNVSSPTFNNLVIPMLRMSELYLIAIETTTDLSEANSLWNTYQRSHNVLLTEDAFASISDVQPVVQAEFMRELFAEGQMFYYYKSHGSSQMKWRVPTVKESEYVLPLPDTEFESK